MPTPEIIEHVRKLHAGLAEAQPDPAVKPGVDALQRQLEVVMLEPAHAPHYRSLADKLLFRDAGFRARHPELAAAMETLADELSNAGL